MQYVSVTRLLFIIGKVSGVAMQFCMTTALGFISLSNYLVPTLIQFFAEFSAT
jgi:hypothetical protein